MPTTVVFTSRSGQELIISNPDIVRHTERFRLLICGEGSIRGRRNTGTHFYMGIYSMVTNEVELWIASEERRKLLYALFDQGRSLDPDLAGVLAPESFEHEVWVDLQSAQQRARKVNRRTGFPEWHPGRALSAMHAVEKAYNELVAVGEDPGFRVRYNGPMLEIQLDGVINRLDTGKEIVGVGKRSRRFFQRWLTHLQRARAKRTHEEPAP